MFLSQPVWMETTKAVVVLVGIIEIMLVSVALLYLPVLLILIDTWNHDIYVNLMVICSLVNHEHDLVIYQLRLRG